VQGARKNGEPKVTVAPAPEDRLAAARAKLDQPRAETFRFAHEGDEIAGTVVRLDVADTEYGPQCIVVVDPGDGNLRSIWLLHDALRSQMEKLRPEPGTVIAVRYLGRQQSANGRSYHAYTVTTDWDRPQFQWGKRPATEPPEEDGDGYGFDNGEPLPPEPDDEPPF
jgi:hypothetical protein